MQWFNLVYIDQSFTQQQQLILCSMFAVWWCIWCFNNDVQAQMIKSDFLQIYMFPLLSVKYISLLTANKICVSVFSKLIFNGKLTSKSHTVAHGSDSTCMWQNMPGVAEPLTRQLQEASWRLLLNTRHLLSFKFPQIL